MTYSRGQVKTRPVTLKTEFEKIAKDKTSEAEMYKRKVKSLESSLRDANHWVNKYQQDLIDKVEAGNSLRKRVIGLVFSVGVVAGIIVSQLIK